MSLKNVPVPIDILGRLWVIPVCDNTTRQAKNRNPRGTGRRWSVMKTLRGGNGPRVSHASRFTLSFPPIYRPTGEKPDRSTDNNCKSTRCLCFIRRGCQNAQDGQAKLGQNRRYAIGCATDAQHRIDLPCNQSRMKVTTNQSKSLAMSASVPTVLTPKFKSQGRRT